MKRFKSDAWYFSSAGSMSPPNLLSASTRRIVALMLSLGLATNAVAQMPEQNASFVRGVASNVKLLKSSDNIKTIALRDAFVRALKNHSQIQLAQNQLQRRRVENTMRISAILPKLRLGSAYTRNIPEVETTPFASDTQALNRHVAGLLRKSGDTAAADELEQQADLMLRRRADSKIVMAPKHVFDAKLSLEIPLFNGPDIARVLSSGENVQVQEARLRDEEAKTIFLVAKSYFAALHLRNVLVLREQAESVAEERFQKAQAEQKRGVIMEKDFLHAHANFAHKQAERNGALIDYRASIAELGLVLGMNEEFAIQDPDQLMFQPLNGDTDRLIEVALQNRPDLRAERQTLRVVEKERFGQFLQFLPTLSLQGDAKYTSNDRSLIGKNFTYAISLNAQMSLFDGGLSIGQLRETALRRQESEIRIGQLRRDIDAKVRGRKERLNQLALLERSSELLAKAAAESEHVASSRHKRGMIDLQEFLEFSDKRLNADIALKKAQSDVNEEKLALIFEAGLLTPQFLE